VAGSDSVTAIKKSLQRLLEGQPLEDRLLEVETELTAALGATVTIPRIYSTINTGGTGKVYRHELPIGRPPDQFPTVEIIASRSEPVGQSIADEYLHRLQITWTFIGDTEETIVAWVEGAVIATRRLIANRLLSLSGGVSAPMIAGNEEYAELLRVANMSAPLIKGAMMEIAVRTIGPPDDRVEVNP
jgi:hypothetical protein